jgi:hypothetical protein
MSEEFEIPYYEPKYEVFQAIKLTLEKTPMIGGKESYDHGKLAMICDWAGWAMGIQMDQSVAMFSKADPDGNFSLLLPHDNDKYYLIRYTDDDEAFIMDADEFEERYARLDRPPVMEEINEPEQSASYVIGGSGTYVSGAGTWKVPVSSGTFSSATRNR